MATDTPQGKGELLSMGKAMALTGLSRRFLYGLVERGVIRSITIGTNGHRRLHKTDILEFMEKGEGLQNGTTHDTH